MQIVKFIVYEKRGRGIEDYNERSYWEAREQCEEEVRLVVKYSRKKGRFSRYTSYNGSFYFCLNDKEGVMVASNEEYVTRKGVKKAIRAVRKHVARAD